MKRILILSIAVLFLVAGAYACQELPPVDPPQNEPVNEPVEEPVNEPVNEPVAEPVQKAEPKMVEMQCTA